MPLELGPMDLNIKPSANTTNGWVTPGDNKDNLNENVSVEHKNNNIDLDELNAFLDEGSLYNNAPKKS